MQQSSVKKLVLAALFAALTCVATMIIQIRITPNGYVNLGDGTVLLAGFLLGPVWGAAAGGIGSMLADLLLGYMTYVPGTLLIKGAMAAAAALLFRTLRKKTGDLTAALLGGIAAELIMVGGYFVYEAWLLGYGLSAAASVAGNALQGTAGLIFGALLCQILYHIPAVKRAVRVF